MPRSTGLKADPTIPLLITPPIGLHGDRRFTQAIRNWCQSITGWNLALDEKGRPNIGPFPCGGMVTIHSQTKEITRSGQYWGFAHFSRSVQRGAKRFDSAGTLRGCGPRRIRESEWTKNSCPYEFRRRRENRQAETIQQNGGAHFVAKVDDDVNLEITACKLRLDYPPLSAIITLFLAVQRVPIPSYSTACSLARAVQPFLSSRPQNVAGKERHGRRFLYFRVAVLEDAELPSSSLVSCGTAPPTSNDDFVR